MSAPSNSIPDRAAYLVAKKQEAERAVERLAAVAPGSHCTFMQLTIGEAMNGAHAALMAAWGVIDRLQTVAEEELKREEARAEETPE
jgi:hypothetical protein